MDFFKDLQEQVSARRRAEEGSSLVATTGDVVEVATSEPATQAFGHGGDFISNSEREVESLYTHPLRLQSVGVSRTDMWAAKDGAPTVSWGISVERLEVCKPTLCGAIGRGCKTEMWAAKDGAPTVSWGISV